MSESLKSYNEWHARVHGAESPNETLLQQWHLDALALAGNLKGLHVLEVGCGAGDFSIHLAQSGASVVGTDFSPTAVELAAAKAAAQKSEAQFQVADAQGLPFADASFDMILSCECLEHVPDPKAALAEMFRVLKPGGRLVLTTENYSNGMLIYWLMAWIQRKPFNSGAGVQPIEHFFLFWRVMAMMKRAGFAMRRMQGAHYVFFAVPGTHPHTFVRERIASPWLSKLLRPFARHVSFEAVKSE